MSFSSRSHRTVIRVCPPNVQVKSVKSHVPLSISSTAVPATRSRSPAEGRGIPPVKARERSPARRSSSTPQSLPDTGSARTVKESPSTRWSMPVNSREAVTSSQSMEAASIQPLKKPFSSNSAYLSSFVSANPAPGKGFRESAAQIRFPRGGQRAVDYTIHPVLRVLMRIVKALKSGHLQIEGTGIKQPFDELYLAYVGTLWFPGVRGGAA